MKTTQFLLTQFLSILAGAITSSLWFTHSNTWKVFLPIALIIICIKLALSDYKQFKDK